MIRTDVAYAETALAQVEALGFDRADVFDIVMTHHDSDHAGGIDDFPAARLHVSERELSEADDEPGPSSAVRYRPWRRSKHSDDVAIYSATPDDWFGFPASSLAGFGNEIVYVSLPGHTAGHMGVGIRDGDGWILHCGDAFYHRNAVLGGRVPRAMTFAQFVSARRRHEARDTRRRLAELHELSSGSVRLICAHDAAQLDEAAAGPGS